MLFRRITIRCSLLATFLILAGEFQMRLANRAISASGIETAGLLKASRSCKSTSLSVTASRIRVV